MSPRPLAALPGLLAGEAAIAELLGVDDAIVAVPESARSVVLPAPADRSTSPTVLVATATAREAEQLVHDLAPFLGYDAVELLPAWETLPFERVSPATETMGRRLRTMWRLRHGSTGGSMPQPGSGLQHRTGVVVAPIRALLQRLGPRVEDAEPVVVRQGSELDPEDLVARLGHAGYRREYQVEARGELAVRGGIIDVFGSRSNTASNHVVSTRGDDHADGCSTRGSRDTLISGDTRCARNPHGDDVGEGQLQPF